MTDTFWSSEMCLDANLIDSLLYWLIVGYLTSSYRVICEWWIGKQIRYKAVVAYYKVLSRNLRGITEDIHEYHKPG
jgi:hypothetical protein